MLIKNNKTKKIKKGSESTISQNSITDELKGLRTTDVQIPKSHVSLRSTPGGAIYSDLHSAIFLKAHSNIFITV
jgi:hypothetical protein